MLDRLDRLTRRGRSRYAAALFLGEPTRILDRLTTAAYFALSAGDWARFGHDQGHLAALAAGLDHCRPPAGALVLDLGTGTGGGALLVATRFPDARVIGIDTSRRMLRRARSGPGAHRVEFRRASVRQLPVRSSEVSLVTCLNAVPEPIELARVCAPGADVVAATTAVSWPRDDIRWRERWRGTGFDLVESGQVPGGSWERFRRGR